MGLPNRLVLENRLEQAWHRAARTGRPFAVMFLDLDRFKPVNDTFGHGVGDAVLGLADLARADDAAPVGEKILEALSAPICTAGHEFGISCSIGISVYPEDGKDFATLMINADMAMYHAKKKGGSLHFYMPEMRVPALDGPGHP